MSGCEATPVDCLETNNVVCNYSFVSAGSDPVVCSVEEVGAVPSSTEIAGGTGQPLPNTAEVRHRPDSSGPGVLTSTDQELESGHSLQEPDISAHCSTINSSLSSECLPSPGKSWQTQKGKNDILYKYRSSSKRVNFEPRAWRLAAKQAQIKPHCLKVAQYKTDALKHKYVFPKKEHEAQDHEMCLEDDRTMLQVLQDVIGLIHEHYDESEVEYLSRQCGYDASIKMFSATGQPMPHNLVQELVKMYKESNNLKSVGKAVQELAARDEKFYTAEQDGIKEHIRMPQAHCVDTQSALDLRLIEQAKEKFVSFINNNKWILSSASQRRQFRIFENNVKHNKTLGANKIFKFFMHFYNLYFDTNRQQWIAPAASPEAFPGHIYYVAKGERLKYVPCFTYNTDGQQKSMLCLADSGASHNLILLSDLEKFNLNVFPLRKRRLHLFTASGEEKDVVQGECILTLYVKGQNDKMYSFEAPFLVVSQDMNIKNPILGVPFLKGQGCRADWEQELMTARLRDKGGKLKRVLLPSYLKQDSSPRAAKIAEYENIFSAPVSCFNISDFSLSSEVPDSDQFLFEEVHPGPAEPDLPILEEEEERPEDQGNLRSVESAALEMATQCHLIYPQSKAHEVFKDLGGKGIEVELEDREEADEQIFRELDLMSALDDVRTHRDMGEVDAKFLKHCKAKIDELHKAYPEAFSSATRKVGKFKLFQYTPDVVEGSSSKQAPRDQKTWHFPNVKEKIKYLKDNGLIGISPNQSTQYVHNLLFLSKRRASEAGRNCTKADLHIAGHNQRLTDPTVKIRAINDLSDFNRKCLRDTPTIQLPSQDQVQDFVKGRVISSFDITEMFSSIPLHPDAYKYFNFYLDDIIYEFRVLLQGCGSSPFVATEALRQTFNDQAWESLKSHHASRLSLLFHYYSSYQQIIKAFMDDILLASKVLCEHQGGSCDLNFFCPKMNFELTCQLHLQCMEALFFAMQAAGFLLNPEKSQYFVHSKFVFIGIEFNAVNRTLNIAEDRIKSIMQYRQPRSLAEVHSRVSSLRWSAPYLPYLNKILLPLIQLCNQNTSFRWEKRHLQSFNNAKFLVGLHLKKYAYRPDQPSFLITDSSKYSLSFVFYTMGEGGELHICECQTRICSGAESRLQAVNRELICLLYGVKSIEKYIFAAEKPVIAIGDFQSILYLQLNAPHESRVGQAAIYLSKFTHRLQLCYLPGRFLGLADIFSRQFSNVYLKSQDSEISKTLAAHLPPIPPDLKKKVLTMNAEQLTDYVFDTIKGTKLDLWDHARHVRQCYRLNDFASMFRSVEPVQSLIRFLKNPYDLKEIDYEALSEFLIILRDSTKTDISQYIKDEKLNYLKGIIDTLDFKSTWRKVYGVPPPSLEAIKQKKTEPKNSDQHSAKANFVELLANQSCYVNNISTHAEQPFASCPDDLSSFKNTDHVPECRHYKMILKGTGSFPCSRFKQFCGLYSYWKRVTEKLSSLLSEFPADMSPNFQRACEKLESFNSETCYILKFYLFKEIITLLAHTRPSDWISVVDQNIKFLVYTEQPGGDCVSRQSETHLNIVLNTDIHLQGFEHIQLNAAFGFISEVIVENMHQNSLKVYCQTSQLNIQLVNNIALFNANPEPLVVKKGTTLLQVSHSEETNPVFVQLGWDHGKGLLDNMMSFISLNAENRICSLFSDYLLSSRDQVLSEAAEKEERVLSSLTKPDMMTLGKPGSRAQEVSSPSLDQEASLPSEQSPLRRVTRSQTRKARSQSPASCHSTHSSLDIPCHSPDLSFLPTAFSTEAAGGSFHQSGKNKLNTELSENIAKEKELTRKEGRYHGQFMLSQILFEHYLHSQHVKHISREDLKSLQQSDLFLQKIIKKLESQSQNCAESTESTSLYTLEDGVLYRRVFIKQHNITFRALCLPEFLLNAILVKLHAQHNVHLDNGSMYLWLRMHLFCHNLMPLIKKARENCISCIYSRQTRKRIVGGSRLFYRQIENLGPGSILYCDLAFLAYDPSIKTNCILVTIDAISKYTRIVPVKNKGTESMLEAFRSLFLNCPIPKVCVFDSGQEFLSQRLQNFLKGLHIEPYFVGSKNSQMAETHIRVVKLFINRCLQSAGLENNQWSKVLVDSLQALNSRPPSPHCVLSRSQVYFSPLHFTNRLFLEARGDKNECANLHRSHLKVLSEGRTRYKPKKAYPALFAQKGSVVMLEKTRQEKTSQNCSQQLQPSVEKILKVGKVCSDNKTLVCKDLLSGDKMRYNAAQLRSLNLDNHLPMPATKFKLAHLSSLIPEVHGSKYARNVSSLTQPECFSILPDQSEASPHMSSADQSGAGLKSILKVKTQKICQPYRGALRQNANDNEQLQAYFRAFNLISDLNLAQIKAPNWLVYLTEQPYNHGCMYSILDSAIYHPLQCSHSRKVRFEENHESMGKYRDRKDCCEINNVQFKQVYCSSGREIRNQFISCLYNLLPDDEIKEKSLE